MNSLIHKETLLKIKIERDDVNKIIAQLNTDLQKARKAGYPSFIWETYKLIKAPIAEAEEQQLPDTVVPIEKIALLMVIDELHNKGYNVRVYEAIGPERVKMEIYWDKEDLKIDEPATKPIKPPVEIIEPELTDDPAPVDKNKIEHIHKEGLDNSDWDYLMRSVPKHKR
jgi:hypothetical protein